MKIELKIDGLKVQFDQKASIAVTHSIADVQEPDNTSAGYSKSVEVPLTPANMRVFRFTNELYSKEQFNNELHTAEFVVDGNTVMSGIAQIDKITCRYDAGRRLIGGSFHVSVIGAAFEWITSAKRRLDELVSDETVTYTMDDVYANSVRQDVSLVKFFPVDRGAFWNDVGGVKVPRTHIELFDYHPFFNVWKTLELIFKGYMIRTSMKELFEKLYCSGYLPQTENSEFVEEECDFHCGTNIKGSIQPNTLVNIFNDWKTDVFFGDKILKLNGNNITYFAPTSPLKAIFNLTMTFTSRLHVYESGLIGYLNRFSFGAKDNGTEPEYHFDFPVEKSEEYGKVEAYDSTKTYPAGLYLHKYEGYNPSVIDEVAIYFYDMFYMSIAPSGWWSFELTKDRKFDIRVRLRDGSVIKADLLAKNDPNFKVWLIPTKGSLTFECNEKIGPLSFSGTNSFAFACKFGYMSPITGVNDSVNIVMAGISPEFGNYIGTGDKVGLATVGGTNTQLDFIAAVRQMFNLMFYTNPLTREVFVEPRTRFYNLEQSEMVDWRGKIDYAKEIEIEELGADIGKTLKLAYADGNEVVEYYNWKYQTRLGTYSTPLLNKTTDDTKEIVNPMFAPFLNREVSSVGMFIPQEQRENTQDTIDDADLGITPIIGCFTGVERRPSGSDLNRYSHYPQLIFQDDFRRVNLGFDDVGWLPAEPGLNQYYQGNISAYNVGRRITMHLKLEPQDVEAILCPNDQKRDFRAVFLLTLDGEDVPCLLESVEDYNPAGGASTRCVFISDPNIRLTGDGLTVVTHGDTAVSRDNELIGYR